MHVLVSLYEVSFFRCVYHFVFCARVVLGYVNKGLSKLEMDRLSFGRETTCGTLLELASRLFVL